MSVKKDIRIDNAHGTIHPDHMEPFPDATAVLSTHIHTYGSDIKLDAPIYEKGPVLMGKHTFFDTK